MEQSNCWKEHSPWHPDIYILLGNRWSLLGYFVNEHHVTHSYKAAYAKGLSFLVSKEESVLYIDFSPTSITLLSDI